MGGAASVPNSPDDKPSRDLLYPSSSTSPTRPMGGNGDNSPYNNNNNDKNPKDLRSVKTTSPIKGSRVLQVDTTYPSFSFYRKEFDESKKKGLSNSELFDNLSKTTSPHYHAATQGPSPHPTNKSPLNTSLLFPRSGIDRKLSLSDSPNGGGDPMLTVVDSARGLRRTSDATFVNDKYMRWNSHLGLSITVEKRRRAVVFNAASDGAVYDPTINSANNVDSTSTVAFNNLQINANQLDFMNIEPRVNTDMNFSQDRQQAASLILSSFRKFFFSSSDVFDRLPLILSAINSELITKGEYLMRKDEKGDKLYVIMSGKLDVLNDDGVTVKIQLGHGDLVGEVALVYNEKRMASVKVSESGTVFSLSRKKFRELQAVASSSSIVKRCTWLHSTPCLAHIGYFGIARLSDCCKTFEVPPGGVIISEGEVLDRCIIFEDGKGAEGIEVSTTKDSLKLTHAFYFNKNGGVYKKEKGEASRNASMNDIGDIGDGDTTSHSASHSGYKVTGNTSRSSNPLHHIAEARSSPPHAPSDDHEHEHGKEQNAADADGGADEDEDETDFPPTSSTSNNNLMQSSISSTSGRGDGDGGVGGEIMNILKKYALGGKLTAPVGSFFGSGLLSACAGVDGPWKLEDVDDRDDDNENANANANADNDSNVNINANSTADSSAGKKEKNSNPNPMKAISPITVRNSSNFTITCSEFSTTKFMECIGGVNVASNIRDRRRSKVGLRARLARKSYCIDDFEVVNFLGQGSFGYVRLVKTKADENANVDPSSPHQYKYPPTYALKAMNKHTVYTDGQLHHTLDERTIASSMDHPNVLQVYSTFQSPNEVFILSEYISGCDLWAVIHNDAADTGCESGLPPSFVYFYSACAVEALGHVHSKGIAYRDLKPENMMVDSQGYLKLIDFGFAKKIPYTVTVDCEIQLMPKSFTMCGTPEYLAPEFITSEGHDHTADLWALGVMIHEMVTATSPFTSSNMTKLFTNIVTTLYTGVPIDKNFDKLAGNPHVSKLIKGLCAFKGHQRLGGKVSGMKEVKVLPCFKSIDFEALVQRKVVAPWIPNEEAMEALREAEEDVGIVEFKGDQKVFEDFR